MLSCTSTGYYRTASKIKISIDIRAFDPNQFWTAMTLESPFPIRIRCAQQCIEEEMVLKAV